MLILVILQLLGCCLYYILSEATKAGCERAAEDVIDNVVKGAKHTLGSRKALIRV